MYAVIPGPQKVWAGSVSSHTPVHTLSFISSVWKEKNKKKTQQFKKKKKDLFPGKWFTVDFPTCPAEFRLPVHLSDAQAVF